MPRSALPGRRSAGVRLLAVPAVLGLALTACTPAGGSASEPAGEVDQAFLDEVDAALAGAGSSSAAVADADRGPPGKSTLGSARASCAVADHPSP